MSGPRVAVISRAEYAVIRELAHDGADNAEIADRLGISVDTVKCHFKGVMKATGEPTRTALAVGLLRGRIVLRTVTQPRRGETKP